MASESKEEAVAEAPSEKKSKITLVVILAILTGILLILSIGGLVYHFQSGKAQKAELAAAKNELKGNKETLQHKEKESKSKEIELKSKEKELEGKTLLVTELQEQVAGLSKQVQALQALSVAKENGSAASAEKQAAQEGNAPSTVPAPKKMEKELTSLPVVKKARRSSLDCQMVGKSLEEQITTLQRCTRAMDGDSRR